MSDRPFGPFHARPRLTAAEWKALDELRTGVTLVEAAERLGLPEKTLRHNVANAAEKLRIAASL